jgi:DNA-binding transcriptional MerR regulator
MINNYKQHFAHLNEDYQKTSVISQLLDLGYSIDDIVDILDNTGVEDVVKVLDDYAQNKMKYTLFERWQRRFGNEQGTKTEELFG